MAAANVEQSISTVIITVADSKQGIAAIANVDYIRVIVPQQPARLRNGVGVSITELLL